MKNMIYTIPLALALVGLLGQHTAFATNESSYKSGLEWGFDDYQDGSHDSDSSGPAIGEDTHECMIQHNNDYSTPPGLTNSTACRDGYLAGWEHWCKSDGVNCASWVSLGFYPSIVTHVGKVYHCRPWCPDYVKRMNVTFTQSF